ncbi:MAG: NADH-quinone oxidoreductase subunit C [Candidatus Margulisbacteria bacterium]|jgi:Ni,Fe-hydrogenase III large subunit/Ni,Fe-hydrogenase III component G|nr:NADH-quinone oxidoreductase subunit C [Candidatus Margulisiibacteriota bacterium]
MSIREELKKTIAPLAVNDRYPAESYLTVKPADFIPACLALHQLCASPVMMMFAEDKRATRSCFRLNTAFYSAAERHWYYACLDLPAGAESFPSLAKEIYSATLFEREIREMFGIELVGSPDHRRLRLHDEVWPAGAFPLRKDFVPLERLEPPTGQYEFIKGEGEGLFELPVGPVHAGIIGPGHFHFSVAGEPIINLEIRLGFTHRGIEKLMEGKTLAAGLELSERVAGDTSFAHGLAFCLAAEKIAGLTPPPRAVLLRAVYLELERMYNHINDIGGIALDVGFSFASAFASVLKERLLRLNEQLSGNRYLRGINVIGGVAQDLAGPVTLNPLLSDLNELEKILFNSASFIDRIDSTGILRQKTAEDLGVLGLAGRASGLARDLRTDLEPYSSAGFRPIVCTSGDCLARLNIRLQEFRQSSELIGRFIRQLQPGELTVNAPAPVAGYSLGAIEGWRGPVLYWLKLNEQGTIERCKIVDPSFHNWEALAYAAQGEIIPDFPLCNKSFDLSYSGNDL